MAYPKDPAATDKWQAIEDRLAAAEQVARVQEKEARRWEVSAKKARAELVALGKQHKAFLKLEARAIKKAVSAARGELIQELAKLESTLYDARIAANTTARERGWRHREQPELARMQSELRENESLLAAQSSRLLQFESRSEHSKQNSKALAVAAAAAEQGRVAAEAASADAEAETVAAEAEKSKFRASLSEVQSQLKAAEAEVGKVTARLEQQVEQRLRIADLPETRNWNVSAGAVAVYRSKEVQALVELLESRPWRPEDIAAALASACFKDTAEPISLQVFDQKEF